MGPRPSPEGQRWAVGSPLAMAIQNRALAPRQPRACPSHWASLCPGGKCLLANSPLRFREQAGQWRREEKGGPVPPHLSPPLHQPGSVPPLGWVLCYRYWWVTGNQTQEYCCLHNCSSNSNKQFSLPKSDRIICLAILLQYQPHIQDPGLHTLPTLL